MKCKDCNSTLCSYRTSDAEKDCFYESHPDYSMPIDSCNDDNTDWQDGANYVLEQIENFMKGLNLGNSAEEKFYKLDVLADIHGFIQKLKEK